MRRATIPTVILLNVRNQVEFEVRGEVGWILLENDFGLQSIRCLRDGSRRWSWRHINANSGIACTVATEIIEFTLGNKIAKQILTPLEFRN